MKSFFPFLLIIFIYNGCSNKNETLTCSDLENQYKRYNYLNENPDLTLNTIKGEANKRMSQEVLIYDLTQKFRSKVNTYTKKTFYAYKTGNKRVLRPYINKYCNRINLIIHKDTNQTKIKTKFKKIENEWVKDYTSNIRANINGKVRFNEFNGCDNHARKWRNSFIAFKANRSSKTYEKFKMFKREYQDCLRGSIKKYNALIKQKERTNAK